MTNEQKQEALLRLAKKRQVDRRKPHSCLADIHEGYYECNFVSPWTISARDVNADLMILGKDWASTETLRDCPPDQERRRIGQGWNTPTNKNLRAYLNDYMDGLTFSETYSTNVFPFIKIGKKNGRIPRADMLYAARTYALPQIKIVSPLIAVCLGAPAFLAVSRAALAEGGQKASEPLPHIIFCGIEIHDAPHPSMYPGGKRAVQARWSLLGECLERLRRRRK